MTGSRPLLTMPDYQEDTLNSWLSQQQIAAEFGISDRTVRRMIADGRLPAHRIGPRLVRINRRDVHRALAPIPVATR